MRHSAGIWTRNSVIKFINRIEFEFAPKIEWNIIAKRQIKASAFTSINTQLNHSPARKWIDSGDGLMIPHLIRFRNAASLEGSTRTTRCATWAGVSAAPWCGWDSNAERCSEWSYPTCPSFPSSCSVPPGSACPSPPSTPSTLQVILFFFFPNFFPTFFQRKGSIFDICLPSHQRKLPARCKGPEPLPSSVSLRWPIRSRKWLDCALPSAGWSSSAALKASSPSRTCSRTPVITSTITSKYFIRYHCDYDHQSFLRACNKHESVSI